MRLSAAAPLLVIILALSACAAPDPTPAPPSTEPMSTPTPEVPTGTPSPTPTAQAASPAPAGGTPTATPTPAPASAEPPSATPTATPAAAPSSGARSSTLSPSADTTLYDESAELGNGAGQHLFAGITNRGSERRALLRFDLSSIPAGAVITTARLTLTVDRTFSGPLGMGLHRVSTPWVEGTEDAGGQEGRGIEGPTGATWSVASPSAPWGTPGGDHDPNASAETSVDAAGALVVWESEGLLADVRSWLAAPEANHGWLVKVTSSGDTQTAKRFGSKDGTSAARPELLVEFTLP